MAKSRRARKRADEAEQDAQKGSDAAEPGVRERVELALFLAVEILCLLLFVDFLFVGLYVK